jgi:hypothetical protein
MKWFGGTARRRDDGVPEYETRTVAGALESFGKAVAATPAIDADRIQAEVLGLQPPWKGELSVGTPSEVAGFLERNLRRDAAIDPRVAFLVQALPDQACVQTNVLIGDRAIAYRVWRCVNGLHALFGSPPNMIGRYPAHSTVIIPITGPPPTTR